MYNRILHSVHEAICASIRFLDFFDGLTTSDRIQSDLYEKGHCCGSFECKMRRVGYKI